jgi:hypothetical protein
MLRYRYGSSRYAGVIMSQEEERLLDVFGEPE